MRNTRVVIYVVIVAVVIGVLVLSSSIFITVGSGQAGVLYKRFGSGTVTDKVYYEGFHIIAPWNTMYKYDVRMQERKEDMAVLSKDGLSIQVDISYRFRPKLEDLGLLQKEIGPDYASRIVLPEIRSSARQVVGQYTPDELYSSKRDEIQQAIYETTKKKVDERYIDLDAVLIRGLHLPPTIKEAIETKLKMEQEYMAYEFKLKSEEQEALRKKIEADGIKTYQEIVAQSLSDRLLRWRGIEATLELAKSENAKTVVIGQGEDGLPLILGNN